MRPVLTTTIRCAVALLALSFATRASAQTSGFPAACAAIDSGFGGSCLVVAQAANEIQAQLGVLVTGGNPTIGTASAGGLRLGVLPRVSATMKANVVSIRLPDVRESRTAPTDGVEYGELTLLAPSLSGTATVGLFGGARVAPTVGGIGSVDLLGSASWVPLGVIDSGEFRSGSADFAWGAGVRLGLVRESFTLPGASISVMLHKLGTVEMGRICATRVATSTNSGPGYELEQGECVFEPFGNGSDMGELRLDLSAWSTRAVVSKHLLGLGLSAGLGYDRFESDLAAGVRPPASGFTPPRDSYAYVRDLQLSEDRWSAFVGGSFSLLIATLAAEAGWMQGGDEVTGYPGESSDFDPGDGTYFGSVGVRVAL